MRGWGVFLPDLFNRSSEHILLQLNDTKSCVVVVYNVNNVRYADDAFLVAASERQHEELVYTIVNATMQMTLNQRIKHSVWSSE